MERCGLLVKTYATVHPAPSPRLCPLSYPWKPRGAQAGTRSLAAGRDPRMTWSWTPAHTAAAAHLAPPSSCSESIQGVFGVGRNAAWGGHLLEV